MFNIKQHMRKDAEEGFTLIELMVVVLILGILMAIAIPTFLSLTSSAKKTAAQADLTTAITDAAVYFTANGTYGTDVNDVVANLQGADGNINWAAYNGNRISRITLSDAAVVGVIKVQPGGVPVAGAKQVLVAEPRFRVKGTAQGTVIDLGVLDKNGNFYWAQDSSGTVKYAAATTGPAVPRKFGLNSLP